MNRLVFLPLALVLALLIARPLMASPSSHAVGFRHIEVTDAAHDITFPVLLLYPGESHGASSSPLELGPFVVHATLGLTPAEGAFPVVVISHGRGGTNLGYFGIAEHLAARGIMVALPLHDGDNYLDDARSEADITLELRPRHVSLVLDAVAADEVLGVHVMRDQAALIGHSMGGYTVLAAAGGHPFSLSGNPVTTTSDPRVQAVVLLAPATFWYEHDAGLSEVTAPILMLAAEHDELTPGPVHAGIIRRSLPAATPFTYEVIAGAGHFSFLAPFPPMVVTPDFVPAQDPDGFDRAAFHRALPGRIESFLQPYLQK